MAWTILWILRPSLTFVKLGASTNRLRIRWVYVRSKTVTLYCAEYAPKAVRQSTCVPSPAGGQMLTGSLVYMHGTWQLAILLFVRLEELCLIQIVRSSDIPHCSVWLIRFIVSCTSCNNNNSTLNEWVSLSQIHSISPVQTHSRNRSFAVNTVSLLTVF